jgi:hypothetical protein
MSNRQKTIEELKLVIEKGINEIIYERLIAEVCLKKNLARRTAKEYIDLILINFDLTVKDGRICRKND